MLYLDYWVIRINISIQNEAATPKEKTWRMKINERVGKGGNKKGARIEIQPRFKIQYPMKNRYKTIQLYGHLVRSLT
jgi:hypothetical protein